MGMSEPHTQNKKRVIKRVEEQTFTPSNPSLVIKNLLHSEKQITVWAYLKTLYWLQSCYISKQNGKLSIFKYILKYAKLRKCSISSLKMMLYIFEYSKTEFSFQSVPNLHIHVPIGAKQKSELQNFVLEGHPIGRVLETPSTGRTSLLVRSFQKKNKNAT